MSLVFCLYFFFNNTPTTEIYTLSYTTLFRSNQHAAAPVAIQDAASIEGRMHQRKRADRAGQGRSEEHTSELQSRRDLVCRLLLEKKKNDDTFGSRQSMALCLRHCIVRQRAQH